ncbi:MAG: hypothetical protein ACLVL7_09445 [Anaerotruncus massiliensis (ex Togo et al. 2019)]
MNLDAARGQDCDEVTEFIRAHRESSSFPTRTCSTPLPRPHRPARPARL